MCSFNLQVLAWLAYGTVAGELYRESNAGITYALPVVTGPVFTGDMPWARPICRLKMHRKENTQKPGVVACIRNVRAVEVD